MSELKNSNPGHITRLALKAIEKKKTKKTNALKIKKERSECGLFPEFDVLDMFPSKSGQTTLYHLVKRNEPTIHVCCKVLNQTVLNENSFHGDADMIAGEVLLNEARRLALSQHPSVAKFIESGRVFDRPYISCEWAHGQSLAQMMQSNPDKGFRSCHIAWFIHLLSGAIENMHARGICHLDIKPSNVIVCDNDTVTLIDFGAARYIDKPEAHIEVSLKYASPLYLVSGIAKAQDDVYSLALLTAHLFLGAEFDEGGCQSLINKMRPARIPKHVWRLIKHVILHPRTHEYSAASFSQKLGAVQLRSIEQGFLKDSKAAEIFKVCQNVPLTSSDLICSFLPFKYLVASVFFVVCAYLFWTSKHASVLIEPTSINAPELFVKGLIKSEDMASFLSQSPWTQKNILTSIEGDISQFSEYKKAYQGQKDILRQGYLQQENQLVLQRANTQALFARLFEIRANLVSLKEGLKKEDKLTLSTERLLISMMTALNNADATSHIATQYINRNEDALAKLILEGNVKAVDFHLKEAWANHQAHAYFYSEVISKRLIDSVIALANKNAKTQHHALAIENLNAAILFLGDIPFLREKVLELTLDASEHILFSTVTEKLIFSPQELRKALLDLHRLAPEKFNEITAQLTRISANAIEQSYKKTQPANGALAMLRALNDHNAQQKARKQEEKEEGKGA